jgi:hypothetical protein
MTERLRARSSAVAALPAVLLASAPIHAAAPVTAEEALETYQKSFDTGKLVDCRRAREGDEIIVCGRSGRIPTGWPFPDEREPGAPVRLLPGEPPSAVAALGAGSGMNCASGSAPRCSGGLDVFRVASVLGKAFKALTGRE